MSRVPPFPKADQLDVFQPLRHRPEYQTLPPEVKQRLVPMLARLLREHLTRPIGGAPDREARDE